MIKVGIVGSGYIARAHAAGYAAQPAGRVSVTGVADLNLERARTLAEPCDARAYASLEELLDSDVQALSLCTPTPTHADLAVRALHAGKHVLCEKPLARTREQAQMLLAEAQKSNARLMIGHVSRYEADHRAAYDLVRSGRIGRLRMGSQTLVSPFPAWDAGWFRNFEASGGPVLDLAVHAIDYLLWLFASPPLRVYAVCGKTAENGLPLQAYISFRCRNGCLGSVETSWAEPECLGLQLRTELTGDQGRIAWDYDHMDALTSAAQGGSRQVYILEGENGFAAEIADFLAMVEENKPSPVPALEAYQALDVALGALESIRSGQPVILD